MQLFERSVQLMYTLYKIYLLILLTYIMKIYFSGAIRWWWDNREIYKEIIDELKKYGEILNPRVADESLFAREAHLTDHEIFVSDLEMVQEADLIFAEISQPSLGVGYEIWYAEAMNKDVMVFFRTTSEQRLSVMINGNSDIEIHYYANIDEARTLLKDLFDRDEDRTKILEWPMEETYQG